MKNSQTYSSFKPSQLSVMLAIMLVMWPLWLSVSATPCVEWTPFLGKQGQTQAIGRSFEEYDMQWVEDTDDTTRLTAIRYCTGSGRATNDPQEDFRAFEPTFRSDSYGTMRPQFGWMDNYAAHDLSKPDICTNVYIDEELTKFIIFSDSNDCEGFILTGNSGRNYTIKANGVQENGSVEIYGRIVGFHVWFGYGATVNQPMNISIGYNVCNCPESKFIGRSPPSDMSITALSSQTNVQQLDYQDNIIAKSYGQNCGGYTARVSPDLSFVSLGTGFQGQIEYTDRLILTAPDSTYFIGQHQMELLIQHSGFDQTDIGGKTGNFNEVSYDFVITVNPCQVTNYFSSSVVEDIIYTIGDSTAGRRDLQGTNRYGFLQMPNCGYEESLEVYGSPISQNRVIHNRETKDFTVLPTEDLSLVGIYTVTIRSSIMVPDDYTMQTYTEFSTEQSFTVEFANPCHESTLAPFEIEDMERFIGQPAMNQVLVTNVQDSVSQQLGNRDGLSYCGERAFDLIIPEGTESFIYFEESSNTLFLQSEDQEEAQNYEVTLVIYLEDYSQVTKTAIFSVSIHICEQEVSVSDMEYRIGSPTQTGSSYEYLINETCQNFAQTIEITGLPSFVTHNEYQQSFTIEYTEDLALADVYTVTISSVIRIPDYPAQYTYTAVSHSHDFVIDVQDPCTLTYLDLVNVYPMHRFVGQNPTTQTVDEVKDFVSENKGNFDGVTFCGDRVYEIEPMPSFLEFNPFSRTLKLLAEDKADVGEYLIQVAVHLEMYPDIQTMTSFSLTIELCEVTTLSTVGDFSYTIGDADYTSNRFIFQQSDACSDSPFTINVHNLPDFVQVNQEDSTFSIVSTDDPFIVGVYSVAIKCSVKVDDNPYYGTYSDFSNEYEFTIEVIDPCETTSFVPYNIDGMERFVGQEAITQDLDVVHDTVSLQFGSRDGETFCGDRQYTIVEQLSIFLHYNENEHSLTLQPVTAQDAGEYIYTLETSLFYFPYVTTTETFTISIKLCKISIVSQAGSMGYTLGNPSKTGGFFEFQASPDCPSEPIITVESLPEFITHNELTSDFTIWQTDDLSLVNTYTVAIRSSIQIDDDVNSFNSPIYITEEQFLQIQVGGPCLDTHLDAATVDDMTYLVKTQIVIQVLQEVEDSVSQNLGNQDGLTYCGARQYEIMPSISSFPFINFENGNIMVATDHTSLIGEYDFTFTTSLVEYPSVQTSTQFHISILPCIVTELTPLTLDAQIYDIFFSPTTFTAAEFEQTPSCKFDLEYDVTLTDGSPLPDFIMKTGLSFSIQSDNLDDEGQYEIQITGRVALSDMDPPIAKTQIVELQVSNNKCALDEITLVGTLADRIYNIDNTGKIKLFARWSQSLQECPTIYGIKRIVDDEERDLNEIELTVLTHNLDDGSLSIYADDFALDGEVWTIKLYQESTASSNGVGAFIFNIDFLDICWRSELQAGQFIEPTYTYNLWEDQLLMFSEMIDLSLGSTCGGYTYVIEYLEGPLINQDDLSLYTILPSSPGSLSFTTKMEEPRLEGTHKLRVKCINGVEDLSEGSRGNQGMYNWVYSDTLEVTIINPCKSTVVNDNAELNILDMVIPERQTYLKHSYDGPADSVSEQFGNGFNICGKLQYDLTDIDRQSPLNLPNFIIRNDLRTNEADGIEMELTSAIQGFEIEVHYMLTISLAVYPMAIPAEFPFKIVYRECMPSEFVAPFIHNLNIYTSDPPFMLEYEFDQAPCTWAQTYIAYWVVNHEERDLPGFMSQTTETPFIMFEETDGDDAGTYDIIVYSTLANSLQTKTFSSFTVSVYTPSDITVVARPEFILNVHDQEVAVGKSLNYSPGFATNTYGFQMTLRVEMGFAAKFMSYEAETNTFKVHSTLMESDDVGVYNISFIATFSNLTYFEEYEESFYLTVYQEEKTAPLPTEYYFYDQWEGRIKDDWEPAAPFQPEAPIPYIHSMTQTGMLTVRWDRQMQKPDNATDLTTAKIAVRQQQRDLESELVWFVNRTDSSSDRVQLYDALEVFIIPGDPEEKKVEFTWDVLSFSDDQLTIQINFADPTQVSANDRIDQISVTFRGTEYFKSMTGKEVKYGTTVYWNVFRQMDQEKAAQIDLLDYVQQGLLTLGMLALPFCFMGSLLPTWMFINTLQLISHTPLVSTLMPANAHYFLVKYLNILRFNFDSVNQWAEERFSMQRLESEESFNNKILFQCGYSPLYGQNMIVVVIAGIALISLWILLALKDYMNKPTQFGYLCNRKAVKFIKNSHEPLLNNIVIRVLYEVFLDICICIMINITFVNFGSFSTSFHWITSFIFAIGIIAFIVFLFSLLYNGGPYYPGFFRKHTFRDFWKSQWRIRSYDQDVRNAYELKRLKKLRNNDKGSQSQSNDKNCGDIVLSEIYTARTQPFTEAGGECNDDILIVDKVTKLQSASIGDSSESMSNSSISFSVAGTPEVVLDKIEEIIPEAEENLEFTPVGKNEFATPKKREPVSPLHESLIDSVLRQTPGSDILTEHLEGGECEIATLDTDGIQINTARTETLETDRHSTLDTARSSGRLILSERESRFEKRREYASIFKRDAVLNIKFENELYLQRSQRLRTLYFGLKMNHPRYVAIVHPISFLIRRVLYALIIVCMARATFISVFLLIFTCLFMLGYALCEFQWQDNVINYQHIFNEIMTYIICVTLLTFGNQVASETRDGIGQTLISMVLLTIGFNAIIISYITVKLILLTIKRVRNRKQRIKAQAKMIWASFLKVAAYIPILCRWAAFGWGEESDVSDLGNNKSDIYATKSEEDSRLGIQPVNNIFLDILVDDEDPNGRSLTKQSEESVDALENRDKKLDIMIELDDKYSFVDESSQSKADSMFSSNKKQKKMRQKNKENKVPALSTSKVSDKQPKSFTAKRKVVGSFTENSDQKQETHSTVNKRSKNYKSSVNELLEVSSNSDSKSDNLLTVDKKNKKTKPSPKKVSRKIVLHKDQKQISLDECESDQQLKGRKKITAQRGDNQPSGPSPFKVNKDSKGQADKENAVDQSKNTWLQISSIDEGNSRADKLNLNTSNVIIDTDFDTLESPSRNYSRSDIKGVKDNKTLSQISVEKIKVFSQQSESMTDCLDGLNNSNSGIKNNKDQIQRRGSTRADVPRLYLAELDSEENMQIQEALDQQSPVNTGRKPSNSNMGIKRLADQLKSSPSEGDKLSPTAKISQKVNTKKKSKRKKEDQSHKEDKLKEDDEFNFDTYEDLILQEVDRKRRVRKISERDSIKVEYNENKIIMRKEGRRRIARYNDNQESKEGQVGRARKEERKEERKAEQYQHIRLPKEEEKIVEQRHEQRLQKRLKRRQEPVEMTNTQEQHWELRMTEENDQHRLRRQSRVNAQCDFQPTYTRPREIRHEDQVYARQRTVPTNQELISETEDLDYIPQKQKHADQVLDAESVGRIFNINVSTDNKDDLEDYPYDFNQAKGSGSFLSERLDDVPHLNLRSHHSQEQIQRQPDDVVYGRIWRTEESIQRSPEPRGGGSVQYQQDQLRRYQTTAKSKYDVERMSMPEKRYQKQFSTRSARDSQHAIQAIQIIPDPTCPNDLNLHLMRQQYDRESCNGDVEMRIQSSRISPIKSTHSSQMKVPSVMRYSHKAMTMPHTSAHSPNKSSLGPRDFNLQKNTGQNVLNRIRTGTQCTLTYAPQHLQNEVMSDRGNRY